MKHHLHEIFAGVWELPAGAENGVVCIRVNAEMARRFNRMQGKMFCYSYTIVLQGWATMLYNGQEVTIHQGDMYNYTPGFPLSVVGTSADYQGLCILAEEDITLESPFVRGAIRAAYFPFMELQEPKLSLSDSDRQKLSRRMQDILECQQGGHLFRNDMYSLLYAVFLLDLLNVQEHTLLRRHLSERTEELFLGFIRLLPQHFINHRDIAFYASQLNITPVYLSRIVRQVTGRTVASYVNQMLLMEASWMLHSTRQTLAQIAETLHFSNRSSFIRFFARMKGITPKQFRMEK